MENFLRQRYNEIDIAPHLKKLEFATRHVSAMQLSRSKGDIKCTLDDCLMMLKYMDLYKAGGSEYMRQRTIQFMGSAIRAALLEVFNARTRG